ncbi:unknown [Eggerthella sp. CAG:1427]|nr:unknown [Eggerthella sp. CAG:1427]
MNTELFHPVIERLLSKCFFKPTDNFLVLTRSLQVGEVLGVNVVDLVFATEDLHHHFIVLIVLRHADVNPLVVRSTIGIVERIWNVGTRLRIVSAELLSTNANVRCKDCSSIEVGYNLFALTGTSTVEQSCANTASQHASSVVVAECLRSDSRRLTLLAENVSYATTSCPAYCVVSRGVLFRTILAVTTHLSPNKRWELFVNGFIVKTKLLQSLVTQVNNKNVSVCKKLLHELHAVFVLEVNSYQVLVGVVKVEGRIFEIVLFATKARTLGTLSIAMKRFGLDDGCTHFRKTAYCSRSCYPFAKLYDFNACERAEAIEFICSGHTDFLLPLLLTMEPALRCSEKRFAYLWCSRAIFITFLVWLSQRSVGMVSNSGLSIFLGKLHFFLNRSTNFVNILGHFLFFAHRLPPNFIR